MQEMVEPGHVFRRAVSWLPSSFASQSDAPVGAPRQFGSTEHLSSEAIAAYVDGELQMRPHLRAAHHLSICPQCADEVEAQGQARAALRDSRPVSMPSTLMGLLSQIPQSAPDSPDTASSLSPQLAESPQLADPVSERTTTRGRRKRR